MACEGVSHEQEGNLAFLESFLKSKQEEGMCWLASADTSDHCLSFSHFKKLESPATIFRTNVFQLCWRIGDLPDLERH